MRVVVLSCLLSLGGCGLFSPSYERCDEQPAYAGAREEAPLVVPEGLDMPSTRNALTIPEVTTPERPLDGRCIDIPPSYVPGTDRS
jgi:uncharacterized lipoprotein